MSGDNNNDKELSKEIAAIELNSNNNNENEKKKKKIDGNKGKKQQEQQKQQEKQDNERERKGSNDDDHYKQQLDVIEGLIRLSMSIKSLDDHKSAMHLSHYRTIPDMLEHSYQMLYDGSQLVHSTSTKYTLLGKLSFREQTRMTDDILRGCQYIGTGCLLLFDDKMAGCCRCTKRHCKRISLSIIHSVIQLMEVFITMDNDNSTPSALAVADNDDDDDNNNNKKQQQPANQQQHLGSQKTGAVWEACNMILERRIPQGNRNCIRRDLFTYKMECNETMQEFQTMIDAGMIIIKRSRNSESELLGGNKTEHGGVAEEQKQGETKTVDGIEEQEKANEDAWRSFLDGSDDQYHADEMHIARACLMIIKICRGTIQATIQACDVVGDTVDGPSSSSSSSSSTSSKENNDNDDDTVHLARLAKLTYISRLYDNARAVGEGMTDLGTTLYPPMTSLDEIEDEVNKQSTAIENAITNMETASELSVRIPQDLCELLKNLSNAITKRKHEALEAIKVKRQMEQEQEQAKKRIT